MSPRPFVHDSGPAPQGGSTPRGVTPVEAPPLLLLHAFPLDASHWDHQVAAWSGRLRCLRPDMYGCGRSPLPEGGQLSLEGYARDLLEQLDAMGVGEFACVGLSMGGYVTLALLALAPRRITAMVLASTSATADGDGRRRERQAIADRVLAEGLDFLVAGAPETALAARWRDEAHIVDPLRGRVRRWTPTAVAAVEHALMERPDRSGSLAGVRVPTLVLGGSEDRLTTPDALDRLAAAIPGARRRTLEGHGHLCNLEAPHRFSQVVGAFLESAPVTSPASSG